MDSGSTDNTLRVAEEYGCRIYKRPLHGFGEQKSYAVKMTQNEWVLVIDADERIPEETRSKIEEILRFPDADAYSFPRKNIVNGRWIRHGGWWPDRVIRLFKRSCGRVSERLVHERVIINGRIVDLETPIIHYPIRNIEDILNKINLYSTLGAQVLKERGEKGGIIKAITFPAFEFFYNYFIRLGILDGYEGLLISLSNSIGILYKYLKLKEINR